MAYFRKVPAKNSKGYSWSYTIDLGKDPHTGKRRQKTKRGFSTKGEAQSAAALLTTQLQSGEYIEPNKTNFKDFFEDFIENHYKPKVAPSTSLRAEVVLRNHIAPSLGNIQIQNLKAVHLDKFYSEKLKEGLAHSYIRMMHDLISMTLDKAVLWEMIPKNVAKNAEPPKRKKSKFDVWTLSELETFLEGIKHIRYYQLYLLAAHTGMRKGEVIAIRWKDLDLEKGYVRVSRTFTFDNFKPTFTTPKTESSIRNIKLPESVLKEMKAYRIRKKEECLSLGVPFNEDDLIFTTRTGNPVMPSQVQKDFDKWIKKLELSPIRFHDLRHSHATILILELNVNIKAVSERLGHSNIKMTLDTYSHVLPQTEESLAETLDAAIQLAKPKSGHFVVNSQNEEK
ncbi:MAG: tyrosine-type recombinase/integrase [Bacillota bacterium]